MVLIKVNTIRFSRATSKNPSVVNTINISSFGYTHGLPQENFKTNVTTEEGNEIETEMKSETEQKRN